jgi:heme-degrading monooxygenase HmoA
MFGTIMRARTKPGQRDAFIEAMRQRGAPERNPGFLSAEVCAVDKDPNGVVAVIHFRDREGYMANAQRPETDADYREMLQYLDGPPEWTDVEYRHFTGEPLTEASTAAAR